MLVAAATLICLQVAGFHHVRLDDAYVTFRYGQNLALGRGLVFNPGDHLLGTTSPGAALLSAIVYRLVGHDGTPTIMSALGCIGWGAQAALTFVLVRRSAGRLTAAAAALAIGAGLAYPYAFVALETNIVVALLLAAFVLTMREAWLAAGAVVGAAIVFRPDAAIAAAAILSYAAWRLRRGVLRPAAAMLAVTGPWVAFATYYYGSPLPHTLSAKAHRATFTEYLAHLGRLPVYVPDAPTAALVVAWPFAIYGGWVLIARDRRWAVVLSAGVSHALAYLVLRPQTGFSWHLCPAAVFFAIAAVVGAVEATLRVSRPLALAVAVLAIVAPAHQAITFSLHHAERFWYGRRDAVYRDVAAYLRARAAPGDVFDAEEVGTIAYYSDLAATDHPGLVTRDPAAAHQCARSPSCPQPRWLVMNNVDLESHAAFCRNCGVVTAGTGRSTIFLADRATRHGATP